MAKEELHRIHLSEVGPENPPDLLKKIKESIEELLDVGFSGAGQFVKGKSQQETAKALEIRAKAFQNLADLELERERLLNERNKIILEDNQKMFELKTKRLEVVLNCLIKLKESGVNIDIEVVVGSLLQSSGD